MNLRLKATRALSYVNPFAKIGVERADRISWQPYFKNGYYTAPPLPNPVRDTNFLPTHMDPETQENSAQSSIHQDARIDLAYSSIEKRPEYLPQPCNRALHKYKQCELINGKNGCKNEGNNLVEICPNFALDIMRKHKLKNRDNQLTQIEEYNKLMTVSEYNKGRTIKDIDGSKKKIHGTKAYLRPDSIWADERYINVTYEEIMQVRKELAEQGNKVDFDQIFKKRPYDWKFSIQVENQPIYQG